MAAMQGGVDIDTGALVLIGPEVALLSVARQLRQGRPGSLSLGELSGRPKLRPIRELSIKPTTGSAWLAITGDVAILSGARAAWIELADGIELFVAHNDVNEPGAHAHIDAGGASPDEGGSKRSGVALVVAGPVSD